MKVVKWRLSNGLCGCDLEGEIEVEDDTSREDIWDYVLDDMWNYANLSFEVEGESS